MKWPTPPNAQPLTPGRIRGTIEIKKAFAAQAHPDSQEYFRCQQQIAELERELHALEGKAA